MTTIDKTITISKFMGAYPMSPRPDEQRMVIDGQFPNGADLIAAKDMLYHKSWDWIMPVVRKIDEKIEITDDRKVELIQAMFESVFDTFDIVSIILTEYYNENQPHGK